MSGTEPTFLSLVRDTESMLSEGSSTLLPTCATGPACQSRKAMSTGSYAGASGLCFIPAAPAASDPHRISFIWGR
jgi:hypothetical protein